jgi:hypothetical protein
MITLADDDGIKTIFHQLFKTAVSQIDQRTHGLNHLAPPD